jgi:hypothetical protein
MTTAIKTSNPNLITIIIIITIIIWEAQIISWGSFFSTTTSIVVLRMVA